MCGQALSWRKTIPLISMSCLFFLFLLHGTVFVRSHRSLHKLLCYKAKNPQATSFSIPKKTVHMVFKAKIVCLNLPFLNDVECCHSMDCCFNSSVTYVTHVSSPVIIWLKKSQPPLTTTQENSTH